MGIVVLVMTYIVLTMLMIVVGPLLFYWVTKKLVKYKPYTLKQYTLFWICWIVAAILCNELLSLVLEISPEEKEDTPPVAILEFVGNLSLATGFLVHVLLSKTIFNVSWIQAFKASAVYFILLSISFVVLAFVIMMFGIMPLFR